MKVKPAVIVGVGVGSTITAWLVAVAIPKPSVIVSVGLLSMLIAVGLLHIAFHLPPED